MQQICKRDLTFYKLQFDIGKLTKRDNQEITKEQLLTLIGHRAEELSDINESYPDKDYDIKDILSNIIIDIAQYCNQSDISLQQIVEEKIDSIRTGEEKKQ